MKLILVFLATMFLSPVLHAKDIRGCRKVKNDCVGLVFESDGYLWFAKRVVVNGVERWDPIKKADCPRDDSRHEQVVYARDDKYGYYKCIYYGNTEPTGNGVRFFIRTHKVLLITDSVMLAASMADAASAVHCQHTSPECFETNYFLPRRPTNLQLYGFALGTSSATIAFDHWFKHGLSNSDFGLIYLGDVALTVTGYYRGITANIDATQSLEQQKAKARAEFEARF